MKRKLSLLILLAAAVAGVNAQTLLGGVDFSAKLPKNFSIGAGAEFRSANWFDNAEQWSVEASLGYKPIKALKFTVGYKFLQEQTLAGFTKKGKEYPNYWDNKHRVSGSVTGSIKAGKFEISLRERYQFTYRPTHLIPYVDPDDGNRTIDAKSSHILRSRLQVEFKAKKKSRWKPFANCELYSLLHSVNHTEHTGTHYATIYDKFRVSAGTDFKINKHNSLELFYRYTTSVDLDENDAPHTIGLVYSFSL